MKLFYTTLIIAIVCCSGGSRAQNLSPIAGDSSNVMIYGDPRLLALTKKHAPQAAIYAARGFRVQIYSGSDRGKATQAKVDFMRRFPGIRTYMSYMQPQFRVKVGDYKTRDEAAKLYHQINNLYSPCMIVPDIVEINTLRNDQENQGKNP